MHTGSCLCGAVAYEVRGEFGPAAFCHCRRCRKASGSAFASNISVNVRDFAFVRGDEHLKTCSTSECVHRYFCGTCGSPLLSRRDSMPAIVRLRIGTLDTPLHKGPEMHIFVGSKAEWLEITDALPQHIER